MSDTVDRSAIATALRQLGLTTGDAVLLHSSLSSMGSVCGGAAAVVDAFLEVLGTEGTLVVPIFGALGVVTEEVRRRPGAVCSVHPLAAVAAIGARAQQLCADHWQAELAHGPATPYGRLADGGGYVCLLGVDQDRNTTLHTAEELLRLPYLCTTEPQTFATPAGQVTRAYPYFPGPHRDFIGLDRALRERAGLRTGRIGRAVVRLVRGTDLLRVARELGTADPAFALCRNPHCADCVGQRAHLRQSRLAAESFRLVAAASLAGHYAEEIADRCLSAGITAVELDCVYGMPVGILPERRLHQALQILHAAGCEVAALRLPAPPADAAQAVHTAREHGIHRLVVPLTQRAAALARAAADDASVTVSFYNVALASEQVTEQLQAIQDQDLQPHFTLNAVQFARTGEHPFLQSWQRRLKHAVDQLDVEDASFDGTPQRLAAGNAEIKELISILRCAGFSGYMTLGAGNRSVGTLADTVQTFMGLLEAM